MPPLIKKKVRTDEIFRSLDIQKKKKSEIRNDVSKILRQGDTVVQKLF